MLQLAERWMRFACLGSLALGSLLLMIASGPTFAQGGGPLQIKDFVVGPDETLIYPNKPNDQHHLMWFPDQHTTFMPDAPGSNRYLVFGAAAVSGEKGDVVVLETTDLKHFAFAGRGYGCTVMGSPLTNQCDAAHAGEFDENYAAPGSVVQDPTRRPGNLIMLFSAENHCPGGRFNAPFYTTVGFARSTDMGKTWPSPVKGALGGPARHAILTPPEPQPASAHLAMGNGLFSAFVDRNDNGEFYLYVVYGRFSSNKPVGIRIARAKLGDQAGEPAFMKWNHGAFSESGIGGEDTLIIVPSGCGLAHHAELSYNVDLAQYLMTFVCVSNANHTAAWYYATATSLDLQNWTKPQMIRNSQFPVIKPCEFDGWYPSFVTPRAAAGHTRLTGRVFFMIGCLTGKRVFTSRTFSITVQR